MPEQATRATGRMYRYSLTTRNTIPVLVDQITPERLQQTFGALFTGKIQCHLLPQLHGLNLVLDEALEGGVNESLNLDSHGKSWSFLILDLEVDLP